jgi:hypothetical protein
MQTLSLSLDTLYRHLGPLSLEVATYSKEGQHIIGSEEVLDRMLKDIHFYMDGDSIRRRRAGAVLREFLERFAKELYRKKHGPLPKKYEGAMWTTLKDLIHEGGLDLKDEGRVFESYSFCVSFPHDDDTKEPPTSTEIDAQHMRMNRLKELYLQ